MSIYWAFTTMTTVGYGDIGATVTTEYIVVIFGMLVGASVFGYVIGNVTSMMEGTDPAAAQYVFLLFRRLAPSPVTSSKGPR